MSHRLAPYVQLFAMNDFLFQRALGLVGEDQAGKRLDPSTNSFEGLAAHLLISRQSLAEALGLHPTPLPFEGLGEGTEAGFGGSESFPSLDTLRGAWSQLGTTLLTGLTDVDDATLAQQSPMDIPGIENADLADFSALNVVHESYHIGQLGLIAKAVSGSGVMSPDASAPV